MEFRDTLVGNAAVTAELARFVNLFSDNEERICQADVANYHWSSLWLLRQELLHGESPSAEAHDTICRKPCRLFRGTGDGGAIEKSKEEVVSNFRGCMLF